MPSNSLHLKALRVKFCRKNWPDNRLFRVHLRLCYNSAGFYSQQHSLSREHPARAITVNHLKIRQVITHDLDACHAVESRCFLPSEAASRETIKTRINLFPQGFLVAELNNAIIGMVNSGATNKEDISDEAFKAMVGHERNGVNIVIFSLAVLPEFQKQGIAKQLMVRFIEASKQLGKQKIMLICKSNLIDYYQRYGFIYVGESTSTHGGCKWHEMVLRYSH